MTTLYLILFCDYTHFLGLNIILSIYKCIFKYISIDGMHANLVESNVVMYACMRPFEKNRFEKHAGIL